MTGRSRLSGSTPRAGTFKNEKILCWFRVTMRHIDEYKTTNNAQLYRKLRKLRLEKEGGIRCSYCPYHKQENSKARRWGHKSWKNNRKAQYK